MVWSRRVSRSEGTVIEPQDDREEEEAWRRLHTLSCPPPPGQVDWCFPATAHTPLHPVPWMECADGVKHLRGNSIGTENYIKPYSHSIKPSWLPILAQVKCLIAQEMSHVSRHGYVPSGDLEMTSSSSWSSTSSFTRPHHLRFVIISTITGLKLIFIHYWREHAKKIHRERKISEKIHILLSNALGGGWGNAHLSRKHNLSVH